jgi:hypothetical protein
LREVRILRVFENRMLRVILDRKGVNWYGAVADC